MLTWEFLAALKKKSFDLLTSNYDITRGSDQAPSSNHASKQAISTERIPKSVSRVLNAAGVREEWRAKKRKLESGEDTGEHVRNGKKRRVGASEPIRGNAATKTTSQDGGKITGKTLGIQSGESLAHFNRYVVTSPLASGC